MKVVLLSLLAFSITAVAQTPAQSPAPPPAAGRAQLEQPAELAEAARLSRTFVNLYSAGKYGEALPLAERALALVEKSLGQSAIPVADSLVNLGAALAATKKIDRARNAYERAAAIYETALGPDDEKTNDARHTLGWIYYRKGEYRKAEAAFSRVLESRERKHGAVHKLIAESLSGLAAVYLANGDRGKRDAIFSRLLDVAEKVPEPLPQDFSKMFLSYNCTGAQREGAAERQREILGRIEGLAKKRDELHGPREPRGVVSGGVLNGTAISKPPPTYPEEARATRTHGTVVVYVTVDETGRVVEAEAVCGPPVLFDVSVVAARQALFTPTLLDGQPVKVTGTITYNFNLR